MAERTAASEFQYSKPNTTNSKRNWLNHGKKAEILRLRHFLQHIQKTLVLSQQLKMKWKSPRNLITKFRKSCDIHKAFPCYSHYHHKTGLRESEIDQVTLG